MQEHNIRSCYGAHCSSISSANVMHSSPDIQYVVHASNKRAGGKLAKSGYTWAIGKVVVEKRNANEILIYMNINNIRDNENGTLNLSTERHN